MLLVKTRLGQSAIQGMGLFADEFIPQGTLVQSFIAGIDIEISEELLSTLPQTVRDAIKHYAYRDLVSGKYILCGDNARFLNHSATPNLRGERRGDDVDIAMRDIAKGEELTVDYYEFDAEADLKLRS